MRNGKLTYSLSLPLAMAFRIEDLNKAKQEQGLTALTVNQFLVELIALGVEAWEERNMKRKRVEGMDLQKLFNDFDEEVLGKRRPLLKIKDTVNA
jgi:hypothetical protein